MSSTPLPIGNLASSAPAQAFGAAFKVAAAIRPIISALFILATVVLIRRRDWPLALILLAHMTALPLLLFRGNDRYAMPWYGLMTVLTVAAVRPVLRPSAP